MKKPTMMLGILLFILFIVPIASAADNLTDAQIDSSEVVQTENALNSYDINNENLSAADGSGSSLSDLQILINNHIADGTPLSLDKDYTYDPDTDTGLTEGIIINGAITINGNGYTIDANEQTRILNLKGSDSIVLNGINFIKGSANTGGAIYQGDKNPIDITITNCNFEDNTAKTDNGGAVYLKTTGNVIIENNNFDSNTAAKACGALFADNYIKSFKNNNFTNNIAKSGNAGACQLSTNTVVEDCNFIDNSATSEGGAIYSAGKNIEILNSNFTNNNAQTRGGAVSTGENTKIYNSIFKNNNGPGYGGAVSVGGNSNIDSSTFTNNSATNTGGAVNVKQDKSVTITNSQFVDNKATNDGGAVKAGTTTISDSTFTNNHANEKNGGAISVGKNSEISNSNFENNAANNYGGAIYCSGTGLKISDSNFINNSANIDGGAIKSQASTVITESNFTENSAKTGGAVNVGKNSQISNSNFINNEATSNGGAVNAGDNLEVSNSDFISNSAKNQGGAIYASSNLKVIDSNFTDNDALNSGGAIQGGSSTTLSGSNFNNNSATGKGGAASIGSNSKIMDSTFSKNTATNDGGAVYAGNYLTVSTSTFNNNDASRYGGAISTRNLDIKNSEFNNNTAGDSGGSLKIDGTTTLNNVTSNGGSSGHHGGFLWTDSPTATINNLTVIGASSYLSGGGAYFTGNVIMADSKFYNNTAINVSGRSEGGAINFGYSGDSTGSKITNSEFKYNKADRGSAIFAEKKFDLADSVVLDNLANIDKLEVNAQYSGDDHINIDVTFLGKDNLINGIYTKTDSYTLNNVTYLKNHDYSDDDKKTAKEIYQNVTIEVYDDNNNLVETVTAETDNNGIAHFSIDMPNAKKAGFKIYHKEDNYYTNYFTSLNKNLADVKCESEDITYPETEHLVFKVTGNDGNIPTGNITVNLTSDFGKLSYVVDVGDDGFAYLNISGLNVSNYNVSLRYNGDSNYLPTLNSTEFSVKKAISQVKVAVEDIIYGEKANVKVNLTYSNGTGITGKVNVTIKDENGNPIVIDGKDYITVDVTNGVGNKEVSGLTPGNYSVNAKFENHNFYTSTDNDTFEVFKKNSTVRVSVDDITYGQNAKVKVNLTDDDGKGITGKVNVTIKDENGNPIVIDGKDYITIDVEDGYGVKEISSLTPGNYTVEAKFNGNDLYNPSNDNDTFEVSKHETSLKVSVKDIYVGDKAIVEVEISPDCVQGNVTITIDNESYNATIKDGKARLEIPDLTAGKKTVNVSFPGNENYTNSSSSTSFNVYKHPVKLNIDSKDIKVGDEETISIDLPDDATGNVTITVDGKKYTSEVKNGKAIFKIPGLKAGNYHVKATYSGDGKYLAGDSSDTFKVSKIKPKMDSNSPTIKKGKNGIITVRLPEDATGKVTIEIDGKKYTAEVKDGKAVFNIPNLSEGEHKYKAIYSGDDKYYPSEIEGCIKVIENGTSHNDGKTSKSNLITPTGNPIVVLLLVLMVLGTYPLRKFKK